MKFNAKRHYGSITQLLTPFTLLLNSRIIDRIAIKTEKLEIINQTTKKLQAPNFLEQFTVRGSAFKIMF
jgi:hypothetical protein